MYANNSEYPSTAMVFTARKREGQIRGIICYPLSVSVSIFVPPLSARVGRVKGFYMHLRLRSESEGKGKGERAVSLVAAKCDIRTHMKVDTTILKESTHHTFVHATIFFHLRVQS